MIVFNSYKLLLTSSKILISIPNNIDIKLKYLLVRPTYRSGILTFTIRLEGSKYPFTLELSHLTENYKQSLINRNSKRHPRLI